VKVPAQLITPTGSRQEGRQDDTTPFRLCVALLRAEARQPGLDVDRLADFRNSDMSGDGYFGSPAHRAGEQMLGSTSPSRTHESEDSSRGYRHHNNDTQGPVSI
jgi:hypothetical protein